MEFFVQDYENDTIFLKQSILGVKQNNNKLGHKFKRVYLG